MNLPLRVARSASFILPLLMLAVPATAQQVALPPAAEANAPPPASLQVDDPWLYRGSDIPRDTQWNFGELENGLRYAVRNNGVPPGQVAIRIRIDAGSLYETDAEQGFAHLLEHLSFRESKYLQQGQAIPTWQRLGATFGSDTNAETSPTHTNYKLDLPNANVAKVTESMRLLSGMIREPALSSANLAAEVPIVLAERRDNSGAQLRVSEASRQTFFAGQPLANRSPIGTIATLQGATPQAVQAFHSRWYRPENTTVVAVGDIDPMVLARLVEQYFSDWQVAGEPTPAPDFGDPVAPAGTDPDNPVGEVNITVEPDLPRTITYAYLRPWEQVTDNLEYNRGLITDAVAQAILNRRLEARARSGGSYLYAQVQQDDVSRSADATFVSFAPLGDDWQAAIGDVRGVIEDAIASPPTQEEIDREVAEFDIGYRNLVEQAAIQAGAKLADDMVRAIDIRETVAAPEVILQVFEDMKPRFTPEAVHESTRKLFAGNVVRGLMIAPDDANGAQAQFVSALSAPVTADANARIAARAISFDDLPPIGAPGTIAQRGNVGILDMERVDFANGVRALVWETDNEPGRATVKVRFGAGYRQFAPEDGAYAALGQIALVGSGLGELGEEDLDRIATGRKFGFNFAIGDGTFSFEADTRREDIADQLYLFAAKFAQPRWDVNPVLRAQAAARLGYDSFAANPAGVIERDLEYLLRARDPRFKTPDAAAIGATSPEGFREVWEPILKQGPMEVMVFGDVDTEATITALQNTFGALAPREPLPAGVEAEQYAFPAAQTAPQVLHHRGEADQAAAVVAWPTGGGLGELRQSRQLEILTQVFSNRLLDALREQAGASYAPQVFSSWPVDVDSGGQVLAIAQLSPERVPDFFAAADSIADDLATNGPSADELERVTEPLRQGINRALTGHKFWLLNLEGATRYPQRVQMMRTLLSDYTETTPETMKVLAQRYLGARDGWRLAVLPEGQELAAGYTAPRALAAE